MAPSGIMRWLGRKSRKARSKKIRPFRWRGVPLWLERLEDRIIPSITSLIRLPANVPISNNEAISDPINQLAVSFSDPLQPATVNDAGNWELRAAGPDTVFNTADDTLVGLTLASTYASGTNVTLNLDAGILPRERYHFTVFAGAVTDLGGNANNQFTIDFRVVPPPMNEVEPNNELASGTALPLVEDPAGSGLFTSSIALGAIDPSGEADYWSFQAQAGDKLIIDMEVTSGNITPRFLVYNAAGQTQVDSASWNYFGSPLKTTNSVLTIPATGTYYVYALSRDGGTRTGSYQFRLDLGRGIQLEPYDFNFANDSIGGANGLTFQPGAAGHLVATVAGSLYSQEGVDYYALGRLDPGNQVVVSSRTISVSGLSYRVQVVGAVVGLMPDQDGSQQDRKSFWTAFATASLTALSPANW